MLKRFWNIMIDSSPIFELNGCMWENVMRHTLHMMSPAQHCIIRPVWGVFWLHFCTAAGSGDVSSIFFSTIGSCYLQVPLCSSWSAGSHSSSTRVCRVCISAVMCSVSQRRLRSIDILKDITANHCREHWNRTCCVTLSSQSTWPPHCLLSGVCFKI